MRRNCTKGQERRDLVLGMLIVAAWAGVARSDSIILRGGGEIQGKVIADPKKPDVVQVLLLKGRNPLNFQKRQVLEVIPKASPLDAYLVKREKVAPTAQAEFDLGLWCDRNQLTDLAKLHYEAALGHDKTFEPAHKGLGHVQHDGQWLSRDELKQVQGLVKYKGKWITEEERAKRDESAEITAGQASWLRRIKLLRQAIIAGADDRRREAETELIQIKAPEAVLPLVKVLSRDSAPMRRLLAHILGGIDGKESARALVNMILAESDDDVRNSILDRLKQKEEPGIVPLLIKALRSDNIKVINRAAWALGNLEAVAAVPRLVGVLVTSEEHMVMVPAEGAQGANQGPGLAPTLLAWNGSSVAYLTPPAVGPGVVAYGAFTAPYYYPGQLYRGSSFGVGSGSDRGPTPRLVTYNYQNVEVLGALIKLTNEDFGYDADLWRRWIKTSFNPNPNPVRRVPQP
jgi:HEAT repeats